MPGGVDTVVGSVPGAGKRIVVSAQYTFTDAYGVVVELARAMQRVQRPPRAPRIDFVVLGGKGGAGARAYVDRHRDEIARMIDVDTISGRGQRFRRETSSDAALWKQLRAAAKQAGHGATFPAGTRAGFTDDHTPFLEAGIPAIALSPQGGALQRSAGSMDAVGETLTQLLITLSR